MTDLISRQDAIDAINKFWINGTNLCQADKLMETVKELPSANQWIPVKFRPLTEEELEEYPDYCYMADCMMPEDKEKILVTVKSSTGSLYVQQDVCYFDDEFSLDSGYDWQTDVIAWMPLPNAYTEEREKEVEE